MDDGRTAKAGFLAQRMAFTRLMADAKRGDFDVVLYRKPIDDFSRQIAGLSDAPSA